MSNLLSVKPYDNTFFRDGSKFTMGYSNTIIGKNTPYPSVFFGAIFTALLANNDEFREEFMKKNKENQDHENILKINGVYLHNEKENKTYIKAPLDLFVDDNNKVKFGTFVKNQNTSINQERILMYPEGDFERVNNKYMEISIDFKNYMDNYSKNLELIDEDEIFIKNSKVGISINKAKGVTEESMLYKYEQTEFISKDWSYIVDYEINKTYFNEYYKNIEIKALEHGDLKLGGEGKIAKYKSINNSKIYDFNELKNNEVKSGIIKILLLTEAYFENSINNILPNEIQLLTVVNDKSISIGGYDVKNNNHKKMYKGYSAGTIFLCKLENKLDSNKFFKENNIGFNNYIVLEGEIDE